MGVIPAIGASGYYWKSFTRFFSENQKTVAHLLAKYKQDRIDANRAYLAKFNPRGWHVKIHSFIRNELQDLSVPPTGQIVELGVYKGTSARILKRIFGRERYLGVDANPYKKIEGVVAADIREFADLSEKAALVWNDISTWEGSPRSRLAAFEWSQRNLAKNGIYIDEGAENIPVDLDYSGFELICKRDKFTVFRKV